MNKVNSGSKNRILLGLSIACAAVIVLIAGVILGGLSIVLVSLIVGPVLVVLRWVLGVTVWQHRLAVVAFTLAVSLVVVISGYRASSQLIIESLGIVPEGSKGAEVWVSMFDQEGARISLDSISASTGWRQHHENWLTTKQGWLKWDPGNTEVFKVTFVSHPFSGAVKVTWNGESRVFSLYAPKDKQGPVTLEYSNYGGEVRMSFELLLPAFHMLLSLVGIFLCMVALWSVVKHRKQIGSFKGMNAKLVFLPILAVVFALSSFLFSRTAKFQLLDGNVSAQDVAVSVEPDKTLSSGLLEIAVDEVSTDVTTRRGALAIWGDTVIVAGQKGQLRYLDLKSDGKEFLSLQVPLALNFSEKARELFDQQTLSVFDIAIDSRDRTQAWLYASYLSEDADKQCVYLSLARLPIERTQEGLQGGRTGWSEVFRTQPCIFFDQLDNGALFGTGGRIAFDSRGLLLSVGSFAQDGTGSHQPVSQQVHTSYGKVLRVDPAQGIAEVVSIGHRNPQGLWASLDTDEILLSEHGAQGGDEINLIEQSENYGWPEVTYGVGYGSTEWPRNSRQGYHDGYKPPLFAFVPSVATSQLMRFRSEKNFARWSGDILLATLRHQHLLRLRLVDSRVVYVEPIPMERRIRDMGQLVDGRIVLLTDDDIMLVLSQFNLQLNELTANTALAQSHIDDLAALYSSTTVLGDADLGRKLFSSQCSSCHSDMGDAVVVGPPLACVIGRYVANLANYEYSGALKSRRGEYWNGQTLNSFLEAPEVWAPGTKMVGIDELTKQNINDLVAYLGKIGQSECDP